jgi:hypothetical protein
MQPWSQLRAECRRQWRAVLLVLCCGVPAVVLPGEKHGGERFFNIDSNKRAAVFFLKYIPPVLR